MHAQPSSGQVAETIITGRMTRHPAACCLLPACLPAARESPKARIMPQTRNIEMSVLVRGG